MPRRIPLAGLASVAAALAACGDDPGDRPPIADALAALPGVVEVTERGTDVSGYRMFDLLLAQPVDHGAPDAATFTQWLTLHHRDEAAPLVLVSTGYWNYYGDRLSEPAALLGANQLVVEHRFFGRSRPAPADWSHLTIEQAAADHHRITATLRAIYDAAWIATGGSKGGMTSVYHARFWPDDLDGVVPYVAPISFGAPDYRYDPFVDAIGPEACRQAIRDLEVELLTDRRAMLEARAVEQAEADGHGYTRIALPAAVESAAAGLHWAFWQYYGVAWCDAIPAVDATDDAIWGFLDEVNPVWGASDAYVAGFEAYYVQAEVELGYPGTTDEWQDGLLQFDDDAYAGVYPAGVTLPPFDPDAMADVDAWVQADGARLLFVYGEWDPWTGGAFTLGDAVDSLSLTAPQATHGARIADLPPADRDAALARLEAWTGVVPDAGVLARRAARPAWAPRPPPVRVRGTTAP